VIAFEGISKRYGRRLVLDDLAATLPRGAISALVGPNSAGKTTLIKLLLGLARPDAGRIVVDGTVIGREPQYRARIGYMPQIARFPGQMTGNGLLEGIALLRRQSASPDLSLAEAFGIGADLDRPLGVLSGGTRQKINAVIALAFRPEILVLDEPTAGLDPLAARIFKDRLVAERARGATVLITSHVLPELEELADHVLFLAEGRARWQGEAGALRRQAGGGSLERAIARLLAGPLTLEAA
jgi:Cu-processing system ATP-binding protein